jgi:hypothetical protein
MKSAAMLDVDAKREPVKNWPVELGVDRRGWREVSLDAMKEG